MRAVLNLSINSGLVLSFTSRLLLLLLNSECYRLTSCLGTASLGKLEKRKISHLYRRCVMGSQSEGTRSYWSIYLRFQTTETPLLIASSEVVGGRLTTLRSMAKISCPTRWNTVLRSSFIYLAVTLTQPYVEIHITVYSIQFSFHVSTYRTSGKGKVHPRIGHEGLEVE